MGKITEKMTYTEAKHVQLLIGAIVVAIESQECTYKEVMSALDEVEKNYEKKGNDLLDSVSIQKVAEYGGMLS